MFSTRFLDDLEYWITNDYKLALKLVRLVRISARGPFQGPGKLEPLRATNGCWSRRLTDEHRFVYRVTATSFECIQGRFHH